VTTGWLTGLRPRRRGPVPAVAARSPDEVGGLKRSTPSLSESGRIHGGIAALTVAIAHGTLMHGR
jgi:hypothetical protein